METNKGSDFRENELLEKLKKLGRESKNNGFDPEKFSNLLKEYSMGKVYRVSKKTSFMAITTLWKELRKS